MTPLITEQMHDHGVGTEIGPGGAVVHRDIMLVVAVVV
jgi:hypothetical protein